MAKALLIKSYTDLTTGTEGQWNELNQAASYIQGIETGDILDEMSADKLAALISGVPTPWARARLFKFAFHTLAAPDPNIKESGLMGFYRNLLGEWKGLVALIALFPDRIRFSAPVTMNVKGGDYDIAAAFGRMLFDDRDVWSNQDALAKDPSAQPFIHLIYYRDHLVGGTSPMTGVFTGVDYSKLGSDASDIPWYREGRLEDPTRYLHPEQLQKVYLFVKNANGNLEAFEQKLNSQRAGKQPLDLRGLKAMSRQWEEELLRKGNGTLRDKGPVAQYPQLSCPFSVLFNSNVPVYLKPDFTFTYTNEGDYKEIGDIQNLLSTDKFVVGWTEEGNARPSLADAPVFYLRAKDLQQGCNFFFTLPLSERGADIFKNSLSTLLGYNEAGSTKLSAHLTEAGQLAVTLVVEIDGQSVTLNTREYDIHWMTDLNKVIMWPNFVSEQWKNYYIYSECTSDAPQQFHALFKRGGEFLRTIDGNFLTSNYTPAATEEQQVEIKQLITYPAGQGDDLPRYNILGFDTPLAGLAAWVKESGKDVPAGYLMLRPQVVNDLTSVATVSEATVGIDFGSNNLCIYYNVGDKGPKPVAFENYRSVLVGQETTDPHAVAENHELLFFSSFTSDNGQAKSWLHEHDNRYNCHNESEEVAGGVPVSRPNVHVVKMDEYEIHTQAGILHYNMKWLDNEKGLQKKEAFLKSMWLQTCAFLYKNKIRPTELRWSYPGAMMEADRTELEKIYESLCKVTPLTGKRPTLSRNLTTEAEAVCSFALSQDFGLNQNNLFLGIDVGGSTSDILILSKDPHNSNRQTLFRESSVRIAAGVFFEAIIKSEDFRKALFSFHEGKKTKVRVPNIQEVVNDAPEKAPYYLNSVFDQLRSTDDYEKFYKAICDNAKFVFTIPTYVTGLILFYSGMLIGDTIKKYQLDEITKVDVLSFGKGGRLFHWLREPAGSRITEEYYSACVNAGVSLVLNRTLEVKYREEIEVDNKAEVAKGLVEAKEFVKTNSNFSTDICGEREVKFLRNDDAPLILNTDDEITGDYFANDMNNFSFSSVANFETFMNIFIDFVSAKTKLYPQAEELRTEISDLPARIASFITKDSEYKKASKHQNSGFHYHQPLIIAEGACFLQTLIKKVFV